MIEVVKIPKERKAVLIGRGGSVKKEIENRTKTRIIIKEDVEIHGEDVEGVLTAKDVVTAIGRGFSPQNAFMLFNEGYELHIISLRGETKNTIKRLMGRVIGKQGKARRVIEELTGCKISVYGKTVSIIGKDEDLKRAIDSVELLLSGRKHGYVYQILERK